MSWQVIVVPKLKVSGMALFPFILVSEEKDRFNKVLINHERIHLRQQVELLVLPFYVLYLLNYLYHYLKLRNHDKAYMAICFEREAYANERNLQYLPSRKWFSWLRYLR